jgi:pimeloyl-ACP methyl ester carboxylesterase
VTSAIPESAQVPAPVSVPVSVPVGRRPDAAFPRQDFFLPHRSLSVRHAASPERPTAVFVHGLGGSSLNWTDLMGLLQPQLDEWAIDLGGFGMSPPPRDGDHSPDGHARSVVELIDHLEGAPVHLFGNSLGGSIALQVAARRPDLVRSLTLISPALPSTYLTKSNGHLPVISLPFVGEKLVPSYMTKVEARAKAQGTIDVCFADPTRASASRFEESVEEVLAREHLPYQTDSFLSSLRGLMRTFLDPSGNRPWKLAERVTCPVLVIYGRKDPLVDSRAAHRATKAFRNVHVMVLPDSGHVSQMEHPEIVAAAWERWLG